MRISLPNDFEPRAYQVPFMRYMDEHPNGGRAAWVLHRRGGKDLTAMHQTCKAMHERKAAYWHVFPTAEQARKAIWEGFTKDGKRIMEQVFPSYIRKSPRDWRPNGEMVVELKCGSIWRLLGSDRIEVVGAGPAGVVFSEYALAKPTTWDLIRPMLRESDGWAAFISTPRGDNHFKKLFDIARKTKGWFCELKTLFDTRAYDPEKTILEERESGMPEPLIRQEYLCDWTAALVGSVWGDLIEALEKSGAVLTFGHPLDGVFTVWDLGISDSTAIWFFRVGERGLIEVIDYYQNNGKPLSHFFDVLESKGYRYIKHWLPHDARARTLQTGASVLEQFVDRFGAGAVAITPELSLADGIQAVRWLLQKLIRFHSRCAEGVDALKQYHYTWDASRKVFSRAPEHDWSSHGADAFRYLACVARNSDLMTVQDREPKKPEIRSASEFTLDELWETSPRAA